MRRARLILLVAAMTLVGCYMNLPKQFTGAVHGSGQGGDWDLVPDRCHSGLARGFVGADLYRQDPKDDTELVLIASDPTKPVVLARVPGKSIMVILRKSDCSVLDAEVHVSGDDDDVNDQNVSGSLNLDCEREEIGHVTGTVTFSCY